MRRQNVLVLWLADPAMDSPVIAWSKWNGTGEPHMAGDEEVPPFSNGVEALKAGWRLFQASQINPHYPGVETRTSYLKYEYWFEQIVDVD